MKAVWRGVLSLCVVWLSLGYVQAASDPVELVRSSSDQILEVLHQDGGKASRGAQNKIAAIAIPNFDFQRMTALAVGAAWNCERGGKTIPGVTPGKDCATQDQQKRLSDAFQGLLVRVYSKTMLRFKDAELSLDERPVMQDGGMRATVKSTVTFQSGQKNAKIDYVLVKSARTWKIIDVRVEGGSLVTVYRNQFGQKIRDSGVDGLIAHLQS